jgi:phage tail sheath protein FI
MGVAWGPANELAAGVVGALSNPTPVERDLLHRLDVNVFAAERDGYRLSAGRTLSRDPQWRQLSVRRLMTMVRLSIERRLEWAVFEPNTAMLRRILTLQLTTFLRQLWQAGWLAGTTEAEAYFVRCDDTLNPPFVQDQGRLVLEVGVAPAEPVEFIVLRVALSDDRVTTEERG